MPDFIRHSVFAVLCACGLLGYGGAAEAQGLSGGAAAVEAVRLINGWSQADGSRMVAIEIRLRPGWHTYWRVPGEAGIPPEIDWSASRNLAAVGYRWPRPALFERYGMTSFGHEGALVLPVILTPRDRGVPIEARAALAFGVCEDICAPAEARLEARLSPEDAPAGRATIAAALAAAPLPAGDAGVTAATCRLAPGSNGAEIHADVAFGAVPPVLGRAVFETGGVPIALGESVTRGRALSIEAPLAPGTTVDRSRLRLTLIGPDTAVEILGCGSAG